MILPFHHSEPTSCEHGRSYPIVRRCLEQFVAEEARMLLAELGFRSLEEAIGRADVLSARSDVGLVKMQGMLDLSFILDLPDVSRDR